VPRPGYLQNFKPRSNPKSHKSFRNVTGDSGARGCDQTERFEGTVNIRISISDKDVGSLAEILENYFERVNIFPNAVDRIFAADFKGGKRFDDCFAGLDDTNLSISCGFSR
jgi:hypothetical protein